MAVPAPPPPPELRVQKPLGGDPARELTMQDRLLVTAHIETLAMQDPTLRVIADSVIDCVRCCDFFPECSHVVAESERVDREEGRV